MSTETRFYNTDPRYEMMAALLPEPGENLPDAKEIIEDIREIIALCHHYTLEAGTAKEKTASDLADAIINHLFCVWAIHKTPDLAEAAQKYWAPPSDGVSTADPTVDTPPSSTERAHVRQLLEDMQDPHTPGASAAMDTPEGVQHGVGSADTIEDTNKGVAAIHTPEESTAKGVHTVDTLTLKGVVIRDTPEEFGTVAFEMRPLPGADTPKGTQNARTPHRPDQAATE